MCIAAEPAFWYTVIPCARAENKKTLNGTRAHSFLSILLVGIGRSIRSLPDYI